MLAFSGPGSAALWMIALLVLVAVGGYILVGLRRQLLQDAEDGGEGLTLHSLRVLHAEGKLSDEEFERTKAVILAEFTGRQESPPRSQAMLPRSHPLPEEIRALPGFDLTGEPLPRFGEEAEGDADAQDSRPESEGDSGRSGTPENRGPDRPS